MVLPAVAVPCLNTKKLVRENEALEDFLDVVV